MSHDLTCPKCHSGMRSYERSGITVDQCTGCQGIFLDRGELERLMRSEDVHDSGSGGYGSGNQGRRGFLGSLLGEQGHYDEHGRRRGHH